MARAESTQDRGAARLAAGPEIISGPAAAGAPPKQRSARRKRIELAILLGPPLILFIGFVFVPMIFAIWYSLYNWNGYGPLSDFIGLQNYQGVVTGSVFHQALLHNIIIAVLSVVIQLPISIGLALLLNRRMRGQTALRLAVFTPYVLSQATTAVMWSMLLSHGGPVDSLLKSVGLAALIHFWLASTSLVLYTLFFVSPGSSSASGSSCCWLGCRASRPSCARPRPSTAPPHGR